MIRSFCKEHRQPIAYGIAAATAGAEHHLLLEIFLRESFLPKSQERGMAYGTGEHVERCFEGQFLHCLAV